MEDLERKIHEKLREIHDNQKRHGPYLNRQLGIDEPMTLAEVNKMSRIFTEQEILIAEFEILMSLRFPQKGPYDLTAYEDIIKKGKEKIRRLDEIK